MSVLEKLFDEDVGLCEVFNPNKQPRCCELSKKSRDYTEYFTEKLSHEDWNKMDDFINVNFALGGLGDCHYFKQGFRLAMILWNEVFSI